MIYYQEGDKVVVIIKSGRHEVGDILTLKDKEDGSWFACGKNDDYINEDNFVKLE